ncbi:putative integral membrane protein [Hyella patelloides LEGE 07179]|uniref:Putative integral membrane protein n=1 Tax=Hyella patelloides LEGE 07179 TaxID=945734 RepID=A0A563VLL5_9CYAN|nr:lysylphosphatidylglycerol synthase domain-containing protein [Hyella patelloides]VEP12312.1 putative integral membrane protein [Hyella patelloides LEGE 07179]
MIPQILARVKPYLRWFILGGTLFFLLKTFKARFAEISDITIDSQGWSILAIAFSCTLLAHIWSGWVWTGILAIFQQSLGLFTGIRVYLITNIAKYLPGNVWHFYGRISAIKKQGGSAGAATLSVVLEPLLMAASALLIAIFSTLFGLVDTNFSLPILLGQMVALLVVLIGIHPRILNPLIHRLSKTKGEGKAAQKVKLKTYPWLPFLGEIGFVLFRGTGFLFTVMAFQTIVPSQIPALLSAFSIAWLLGLVVPGAPGGVGVFEATAIALLPQETFPQATILLSVALYRVISILAEAIAALGAWAVKIINNR